MLYKVYNFIAGSCALMCPLLFFTSVCFNPFSVAEPDDCILMKFSLLLFCFAVTFGIASLSVASANDNIEG